MESPRAMVIISENESQRITQRSPLLEETNNDLHSNSSAGTSAGGASSSSRVLDLEDVDFVGDSVYDDYYYQKEKDLKDYVSQYACNFNSQFLTLLMKMLLFWLHGFVLPPRRT